MTSDRQPLPRDGVFDRTSLWLRQCEGFRVYTLDGRTLGYVEELRFGADPLRPEALAVRGGSIGARLLLVPADEVAEIRPHEERIALERSPIDADLLEELREQLEVALKDEPRAGEPATEEPAMPGNRSDDSPAPPIVNRS